MALLAIGVIASLVAVFLFNNRKRVEKNLPQPQSSTDEKGWKVKLREIKWKPILTTIIVLVAVLPIVAFAGTGLYRLYQYQFNGGREAMVAERQYEERRAADAAQAAKAKAETQLVSNLRDAISFKYDTTFVVAAPASGTGYFVLDHGCRLKTSEVNPAHAYAIENQFGRHEILPGKYVYVGKTEYFCLAAIGGPVTEVEVTIFDCPSGKQKVSPPTRASA